jgi:hypothetical protein
MAQEFRRGKQAALGMPPADQGFGTDQFFRAQVDLGLVVQFKLVVFQSMSGCFSGIHAGHEHVDPAAGS